MSLINREDIAILFAVKVVNFKGLNSVVCEIHAFILCV